MKATPTRRMGAQRQSVSKRIAALEAELAETQERLAKVDKVVATMINGMARSHIATPEQLGLRPPGSGILAPNGVPVQSKNSSGG